jgi:drug/metabolite transporter (DMT)-like permease
MDGTPPRPDSLTLTAFLVAVTIGGSNFLGVRVSNLELAPVWGAGLRFGLAAIVFFGIVAGLRLPLPRGGQLALTTVYGALSFAIFYALAYWALVRVTGGVATVVLAVVPLLTLLLAAAQGLERIRAPQVMGTLLAVAGIGWMTFGPRPVGAEPLALLALVGAALAASQGIIVGKRVSGNHPAVTNAIGMATGTVLLLLASAAFGEPWVLPRQPRVVFAVVYLVLVGSVVLFVLALLVVRRWTATATSYLFVLFPVTTMLLEAVIFGEPVTFQAVSGAVLVMSGVWFGALAPGARPAPERRMAPVPPSGCG